MDGVRLTPLKKISNSKGDIFHAMKKSDTGFNGFGEAYFSFVNKGIIKGWKKHLKMTLNLVTIVGEVEFVICCKESNRFKVVKLSKFNYQRLTIKPGLWFAFRGFDESNILLNIASIEHDPNEAEVLDLYEIEYEWV